LEATVEKIDQLEATVKASSTRLANETAGHHDTLLRQTETSKRDVAVAGAVNVGLVDAAGDNQSARLAAEADAHSARIGAIIDDFEDDAIELFELAATQRNQLNEDRALSEQQIRLQRQRLADEERDRQLKRQEEEHARQQKRQEEEHARQLKRQEELEEDQRRELLSREKSAVQTAASLKIFGKIKNMSTRMLVKLF
jgi:hypothetical protein